MDWIVHPPGLWAAPTLVGGIRSLWAPQFSIQDPDAQDAHIVSQSQWNLAADIKTIPIMYLNKTTLIGSDLTNKWKWLKLDKGLGAKWRQNRQCATVNLVTQTFDFTSPSLLVKSFDIPALTHLKRSVNKHLKKRQPGTCMDLFGLLAILRKKIVHYYLV